MPGCSGVDHNLIGEEANVNRHAQTKANCNIYFSLCYIAYKVVNIKKMPRINRGVFFAAAAETKKISRAKTSTNILTTSCMIVLAQNLKI
jgi:hypothetical protein